jgi:hypothetical protein
MPRYFCELEENVPKTGISFWVSLHDHHNEKKLPSLSDILKFQLSEVASATAL